MGQTRLVTTRHALWPVSFPSIGHVGVLSYSYTYVFCSAHTRSPFINMADDSHRPHKRPRLDSSPQMPSSSLSSLTSVPTSPSKSQSRRLRPLPPAILLISLPSLLAHPPTHRLYVPSLCLSLCALRKCLAIPALSPEIECRAWTSLAEIGMRVIGGGLHENEEYTWARGIEVEVSLIICICAVS